MARFLLLLILTMALAPCAEAVDVDVYTGSAAVADTSAGERNRALPLALANVLQKYSGLRSLENVEGAEAATAMAPAILVTFYYENFERPLADGSLYEERRLLARFTPSRVDELARELQLPLWRSARPALEVWVVVDDGRGRTVMPLELDYLQDALGDVAEGRGQPLIWPRPDEDGMYPVDMQLLWGGYTEELASATGVGVLILAARREGVEWSVRANLGFRGEHLSSRLRDIDLERALAEGLQWAIDGVAASSVIQADELFASSRDVTVAGLYSAADYQACLAYLQGLSVVDGVTVSAARPGEVTFVLSLNALPQYLLEYFERDGLLEPSEDGSTWTYGGATR